MACFDSAVFFMFSMHGSDMELSSCLLARSTFRTRIFSGLDEPFTAYKITDDHQSPCRRISRSLVLLCAYSQDTQRRPYSFWCGITAAHHPPVRFTTGLQPSHYGHQPAHCLDPSSDSLRLPHVEGCGASEDIRHFIVRPFCSMQKGRMSVDPCYRFSS